MSLLRKWGLVHDDPQEVVQDMPLDPTSLDAGYAGVATPSPAADRTQSPLDADFATIYAQMNASGDPNTDPTLMAYESFLALPEKERGIAISGMLRATRADAHAIAASLEKRGKVLAFVLQEERKKADTRRQQRSDSLAAAEQQTNAELAELARKMEELRGALAVKKTDTAQADAAEAGILQGFDSRVRAEAARLTALQTFLNTIAPAGDKKK